MEMENLLTAATRDELRSWLQAHGRTEKCCWITVSMTPAPDKLLYLDAVEEALCFGWIDGVKKARSRVSCSGCLQDSKEARGPS